MESVMISAPAKINWTLDITGRDERGYHRIDSLMQRITLYDAVTVKKAPEGIRLSASLRWLPCDERNTAFKAAQAFFEASALPGGCEIFLKKNIPSGAGLAGGSADAAAVLAGLNELYGRPLSPAALDAAALKVGSDVPFMLRDGLCRVTGFGEEITPLPSGVNRALLLVKSPRESASTKAVYEAYDRLGSRRAPDNDAFSSALAAGRTEALAAAGGNVLTEGACEVAPSVLSLLSRMEGAGAAYTCMTGSGSTVFGVFEDLPAAQKAAAGFSDVWCYACLAGNSGLRMKVMG